MVTRCWPVFLLIAAGCGESSTDQAALTKAAASSEEQRTLTVGDLTYNYVIVTPTQCQGKSSPVLIALHGRGGSGLRALADFDLVPEAESKGFILIAPSAQYGQWHDLDKDPAQVPEFKFFNKLLDELPKLGGDPSRVYVTGFSNGGGEALTLGAHFSNRIAAIGAGGASIGALDAQLVYHTLPPPKRKIPVLLFHGMQDDVNGYDMSTFTVSMPDAALWWAKQEQGNLTPNHSEIGNGRVLVDEYVGNGADIELLSYKDLGHVWPSVEDRASGLKFNDILWDFLSKHAL